MCALLHNKYNKLMVVRVSSVMVSQFCVNPTSLTWASCQSGRPRNIIHSMPCRNPSRIYIHSNFLGLLSPQALVWGEVGWSWHFPPMWDFRFQWSMALKLQCKVPLSEARKYAEWMVIKLRPTTSWHLAIWADTSSNIHEHFIASNRHEKDVQTYLYWA